MGDEADGPVSVRFAGRIIDEAMVLIATVLRRGSLHPLVGLGERAVVVVDVPVHRADTEHEADDEPLEHRGGPFRIPGRS